MSEVQDVFLKSFEKFKNNNFVSLMAQKVAKAIMGCRTASLGGHVDACPSCGYSRPSYNSCRNRHCPKCQTVKKERWIGKRKEDMLEVKHFHTVLTIPSELNALVLQNPRVLLTLLFSAAATAVKELTESPKYLGATIGFMSILHTWGSNLSFHPHIHMVVTAGGITPDGFWKDTRGKYFLPVKVLSRLFRGKFLAECRTLYDKGELSYKGDNGNALSHRAFGDLLDSCYQKDWVVYAKEPFGGAEGAFEYLGRYTHRIAISNSRIVKVDDNSTTFTWKDYKDDGKRKEMTLSNEEFLRRFLLHVLPYGFTRIRHYGLYSSRSKTARLELYRMALALKHHKNPSKKKKKQAETPFEIVLRILGRNPSLCPKCGSSLNQEALARASPA
ncbi:MAG: IS91 family transposase [Sphaerochaeta sp.]|nr:IS91 family transposase [Sphaerochaeta sp.]